VTKKVFEPEKKRAKQSSYDPRVDLKTEGKKDKPKKTLLETPMSDKSFSKKKNKEHRVRYVANDYSSDNFDDTNNSDKALFASFAKSASKKIKAIKNASKHSLK